LCLQSSSSDSYILFPLSYRCQHEDAMYSVLHWMYICKPLNGVWVMYLHILWKIQQWDSRLKFYLWKCVFNLSHKRWKTSSQKKLHRNYEQSFCIVFRNRCTYVTIKSVWNSPYWKLWGNGIRNKWEVKL
jgi:hypothetical protein